MKQNRWYALLLLPLLLLCACSAETSPATDTALTAPEEPAPEAMDTGYPVLELPATLPAINWELIPVGAPEQETLLQLGFGEDEIMDTSPTEGADSFFELDRLAPLAEYTIWPDTPAEELWEQLDVSLDGIPLDHVSVCCRGGIVHYVAYNFYARDAENDEQFQVAVQQWVAALKQALEGTATYEEAGSLSDKRYRVFLTGEGWRLEMDVTDGRSCQLRLRSPIADP